VQEILVRNTNKSFTLPELILAVSAIARAVIGGLVVYAGIHFMLKFW
jgi:hypothetical protein